VEIRDVHAEVKGRYGDLASAPGRCVLTMANLMRGPGIWAKTARKLCCNTDSIHGQPVADNFLDRQLDPEAATQT
jgi:hypothetical protein